MCLKYFDIFGTNIYWRKIVFYVLFRTSFGIRLHILEYNYIIAENANVFKEIIIVIFNIQKKTRAEVNIEIFH